MPESTPTIRAPQGAIAWTPTDGWVYDAVELPDHIEQGHYVVVVSERDGMVRGVTAYTTAPLVALLRVDADLAEVVERVGELGEQLAGLGTGEALDMNEVRARLAAIVHRVTRLEGGAR